MVDVLGLGKGGPLKYQVGLMALPQVLHGLYTEFWMPESAGARFNVQCFAGDCSAEIDPIGGGAQSGAQSRLCLRWRRHKLAQPLSIF